MSTKTTNQKPRKNSGMSKNWISTIAKSDGVASAIDAAHAEARTALERRAKASRSAAEFEAKVKGFRGHYASTWKKGKWGKTWVIRALSPMALSLRTEGLTLMRSMLKEKALTKKNRKPRVKK